MALALMAHIAKWVWPTRVMEELAVDRQECSSYAVEFEEVALATGGVKRRRVGSSVVDILMLPWIAKGAVHRVRRVVDVRARPPTPAVQGVRRVGDVRARP